MRSKNESPQFSAVIFDLDGLVLDTEMTYFLAWKKAASIMEFDFSDEFCASLSGLHFQHVEDKLFCTFGASFDLDRFKQLSGQVWRETVKEQGIPVKKGFLNLLKQLRSNSISFCLATNSQQNNALECLELAGLAQVFSIIISRDQVRQGKPAPDIFLAAAKALKTPIKQCLVLEDSSTGIQAAARAGAVSVFIPSIYPFQQATAEMADFFYSDLNCLAEIIKNSETPAV